MVSVLIIGCAAAVCASPQTVRDLYRDALNYREVMQQGFTAPQYVAGAKEFAAFVETVVQGFRPLTLRSLLAGGMTWTQIFAAIADQIIAADDSADLVGRTPDFVVSMAFEQLYEPKPLAPGTK